ncbi:hypothetical protein [Paenibacillus sp. IHBB 10380]|uniref:hypothetical protein n=1 Tax=Paenibacillus sp. IHBB 10380 TaxID=1566358 RepID=UPI0005CFB859|nr:hypothetical protein [Paenibacillus sp. IHBB 10380]
MDTVIHQNKLPDLEKVWSWQQKLDGFGPRLTGNDAHKRLTDYFEAELRQMGLKTHRDSHVFTKWEAKHWRLSIYSDGDHEEELTATFYFPYSGTTPEEGVVGELIYCGKGPGRFREAAGKIAIVDVSSPKLPSSLFFKRRSSYPKNETMPFLMSNPVLSSIVRGPNLEKAAQAGVLGVICVWRDLSEANARSQYLPFTTGPRQCPALWVGKETGSRLKKMAKHGAKARLVLQAEMDECASSDTLYAVLPGTNRSETVIVNTHTDGPNACEENGGVGLLAMARYFSSLPIEQRQRSMVFVFVTGHFQIPQFGIHGQATTRWLHDHPELWSGEGGHPRAVAGLTLEHLGCKEWKDSEDAAAYSYTGRFEVEFVYTGNQVMDELYRASLSGRTKVRSITLQPKSSIYFGEGQPLYMAGIPTVSLIPAPDYLCAAGEAGGLDKLDVHFMNEQIVTFIKLAAAIDCTPTEKLGKPQAHAKGIIGLLVKE